jgi:pimeloyl-ACP methyl ester carboxylesterase
VVAASITLTGVSQGTSARPRTDLWFDEAGSGPPVVLLHSALTDSRSWSRVRDLLATRHRVVRFDARGFGRSPNADAPYDLVEDLENVMRAAAIPPAHLVGNSMGADVVLTAAVARPDLVLSITVVGPGFGMDDLPLESARLMKQWREGRAAKNWTVALAAARSLWLGSDDQVERTQEVIQRPGAESVTTFARIADIELPQLARLSLPALVIVGEDDDASVQASSSLLAATIPGSRTERIAGARHHPQEDQPAAFAAALMKFLAEPISK